MLIMCWYRPFCDIVMKKINCKHTARTSKKNYTLLINSPGRTTEAHVPLFTKQYGLVPAAGIWPTGAETLCIDAISMPCSLSHRRAPHGQIGCM